MGRSEGRDGCLTALVVIAVLIVVAFGGGIAYLVVSDAPVLGELPGGREPCVEEEPRSFADYDWDELSEVAHLISAAQSDDEGVAVAAEHGIHVGDARTVSLTDGNEATMTVVGIRADALADGSGPAGLTLMLSPVAMRPMNSEVTCEGGWEQSDLRLWLAQEGSSLLPADLLAVVRPVTKTTNNAGLLEDPAGVTQTSDSLWAFSLSEVCGEVTLFADEYGDELRSRTYYLDYTVFDQVLSAEGEQYEYFADRGVTCSSSTGDVLALGYEGRAVSWWYRSAYPVSGLDYESSYFYQAMSSGYPCTIANPNEDAGVVVGLCL